MPERSAVAVKTSASSPARIAAAPRGSLLGLRPEPILTALTLASILLAIFSPDC